MTRACLGIGAGSAEVDRDAIFNDVQVPASGSDRAEFRGYSLIGAPPLPRSAFRKNLHPLDADGKSYRIHFRIRRIEMRMSWKIAMAFLLAAAAGAAIILIWKQESSVPVDPADDVPTVSSESNTRDEHVRPSTEVRDFGESTPGMRRVAQKPPPEYLATPAAKVDLLLNTRADLETMEELIDESTLPLLYERLSNHADWKNWEAIAQFVAFAGNNPEASAKLIEFIEREDVPVDVDERWVNHFYKSKYNNLPSLGLTRGDEALTFLTAVYSGDRARSLVSEWYSVSPALLDTFGPPELLEELVRSRAARGLVLIGDSGAGSVVARAYDSTRAVLESRFKGRLNKGELPRPPTLDERLVEERFGGLVTAMATRDMIADLGVKSYWLSLIHPTISPEFGPYLDRYTLRYWEYRY